MICRSRENTGKPMSEFLQIDEPLPTMEVETADGHKTRLQASLGPKRTLIYFLPGTWCPECVGQYHLLQRYLSHIRETGAELVVVTEDDTDTLSAFIQSTRPPLEYTVLADPGHNTDRAIKTGGGTLAIIVDNQGNVRWFRRWPEHQDDPGYGKILQASHDIQDVEDARK